MNIPKTKTMPQGKLLLTYFHESKGFSALCGKGPKKKVCTKVLLESF